jgi:hypothetical protein
MTIEPELVIDRPETRTFAQDVPGARIRNIPFHVHNDDSVIDRLQGPVSVIVSSVDAKAVVLRKVVEIGTAPVTIDGPVTGTWAWTLRDVDQAGQHWMRVSLSSNAASDQPVAREEWQRFHASPFGGTSPKSCDPGRRWS